MLIKRWHKGRKCFVYDVRLINEHGRKQLFSTGHTSKSKAEKYEYNKRNEIAERKMFPDVKTIKKIRFDEFEKMYMNDYVSNLAPKTRRDYKSITKKLLKEFGSLHLPEITMQKVESYKGKRYNEVSVFMANREIVVFSGMCTKAIQWGYLKENPCKGVKLAKEEPRQRALRDSELKNLLQTINDKKAPYLRFQILICVNTGTRKEELLNIKVPDINLDENLLRICGKGKKTRHVPINRTAREVFLCLIEQAKNDYIFHKCGKPMKDFKTAFNTAVSKAKLEDVRPHDLRRTFATNCALKGISPKTLQKWLGHADIKTTLKIYTAIPEDHEREAIERLNSEERDSGTDTSKK